MFPFFYCQNVGPSGDKQIKFRFSHYFSNFILMKTFFSGECSIEENLAFFRSIAENPSAFPNGSDAACAAAEHYAAMIGDSEKTMFWKFTIEFGLMYEEMVKQWCKKCISELEKVKRENTAD